MWSPFFRRNPRGPFARAIPPVHFCLPDLWSSHWEWPTGAAASEFAVAKVLSHEFTRALGGACRFGILFGI